jgi:competence ComEA-like helix-hairpin-helix protein
MTLTLAFVLLLPALALGAADEKEIARLPDGPGKDTVGRICMVCHDSGNFRKVRFTAEAWADSVADMVERGAIGTPSEIEAVVAYLTKNFGPNSPVRINTAPFAEIKVLLGFTVAEARALLDYREKHGTLKNLDELREVPGIDRARVEAQKSRIAF